MKHQYVVTFVKRTSLLDYMQANSEKCSDMRSHYAKERDVRLIVLVRHEGGRSFCTIRCPINPLPVKGEFEVPRITALYHFLEANGWHKFDAFSANLLK